MMSKEIFEIEWKIAEIGTDVMNVKEISKEGKESLLRKLDQVKRKVGTIREPPSASGVKEVENHPLLNDLILEEILSYVDTPSEGSTLTLKSMRQVCQKWKERVTPRLFIRIKAHLLTNGDFMVNDDVLSKANMKLLMGQAPKISHLDVSRKFRFFQDNPPRRGNELGNLTRNWIEAYGHKLVRLTLNDLQIQEDVLLQLLYNFTPNLETLTLSNVTWKPIANAGESSVTLTPVASRSAQSSESEHLLGNLKHLVIQYTISIKEIDLESASKKGMKLLEHANNLDSFTLSSSFLKQDVFQSLFTEMVSMDREVFKNLKKLVLRNSYHLQPFTIPLLTLLNQLDFTNLKEQKIVTIGKRNLGPWLQVIGQKLEKLHVHVVIYDNNDEDGIVIPEMPELKEFAYSYGQIFEEDINANGPVPNGYNARSVIQSMPALKALSFKQCDDNGFPWKDYDAGGLPFSDKLCREGKCTHVEELTGQSVLPVHSELEQLEISCCFKKAKLVRIVTSAFVNLQDLSFWMDSEQLAHVFAHCSTLEKLKRLTIHLSKSVTDFSFSVKSHMANFTSLKELALVKSTSPAFSKEVCSININNLHFAQTGLANCRSFEILSFSNLQVDPKKLEWLRKHLLKSKPKLAINQHCRELE